MNLIGEKIIRLQDAKFKLFENNSNETSIFIVGSLATKLNLQPNTEVSYRIDKADIVKLLCFTFSFKKNIFKKEEVKLDLTWFEKYLALINNHYNSSDVFTFGVKKQSQDRYYFIALEQANGLNVRDLFIQDHVKLIFYANENYIKIQCSESSFEENQTETLEDLEENVLEKFADWFITQDGIKHNYYNSAAFGSNREKLIEKLTEYEKIYINEFGMPVFTISKNSLQDLIKKLEANLYVKSGKFFDYSAKVSTHMPRAILGQDNYLKYLKELLIIDNKTYSNSPKVISVNKIFFGAPGTGKSYEISQLLKQRIPDKKYHDKFVFRVTFHPEYDYASFVGGYKPADDNGEIKYQFVPQIFTNAFVDACNDPSNQYYLVIEEINRGNCAEIFGDVFQLLDRNLDYPVNASNELRDYLNRKGVITNDKTIYWDGIKMLLPDNLTLLATMNTSDQSLMPMDSAFKRRWEWKYVPINYDEYNDEQKMKKNESFDYQVKIGDKETFSWIKFIETINHKISKIDSLGMDKCLGNYFVQVKEGETTISEDIFINKVLFYLWNDVFKDENDEDGVSIFKGLTFMDFFPKEEARKNIKSILKELDDYRVKENEKDSLKMNGKIYELPETAELIPTEKKPELDMKTGEAKVEE